MGKYCTFCGSELKDGSTFCDKCGKQQPKSAVKAQTAQSFATPKKNNPFKTGFYILLIICVLCFGVLLYFLIVSGTNVVSNDPDTETSGDAVTSAMDTTEPLPTMVIETQPPATQPPVTTEPVTEPEETEPPETIHPPKPSVGQPVLYLINVTDADHPIYSGPGMGYKYVGSVEIAGYYTITEEVRDPKGNLWGRLKSGAGWITVGGFYREYISSVKLTVDYATGFELQNANGYQCGDENDEYAVACAFYISKTVTDVTICELECTEYGYDISDEVGSWYSWSPDTPLILWGSFPGDLSAYYISFTDSSGVMYQYSVTISGMDSSLVLSAFFEA